MANKLGVSVDSVIKTVFDKSLSSGLKQFLSTQIKQAINKSSKLEVDDNPTKGFSLTATLELTKDEEQKPVELNATIAIAILAVGMGAGTINLKTSGSADAGNPNKLAERAKELMGDILENMLPKVIKAMEAKTG